MDQHFEAMPVVNMSRACGYGRKPEYRCFPYALVVIGRTMVCVGPLAFPISATVGALAVSRHGDTLSSVVV
jgi:hypothetical protein